MCGIYGEISKNGNCIRSGVQGIKSLEHRGYDSMGIVFLSNGKIECVKMACPKQDKSAEELLEKIQDTNQPCNLVLGHTRWATQGKANEENSHPHCYGKSFVVHNGNIVNVEKLKLELKDRSFYSETDSEVLVKYIDEQYTQSGDLLDAINKAHSFVEGSQAFVIFNQDFPEKLFCVSKGGPLLLGKTKNSVIVASDQSAFTIRGLKRDDLTEVKHIAVITKDSWETVERKKQRKRMDFFVDASKNGYTHYMLKEIFEQPQTIENAINGRIDLDRGNAHLGGLFDVSRDLRKVETFHFVACGTAYNACLYAVSLLNRFGIDARAWVASEYIYNHPYIKPEDAFVFVSQSGETADTIEVIKEIKMKGNICLGIVNVPESRIATMTDAGVYTRSGSEKGVASTKAFIGMITTLLLFAVFVARQRKMTIDTGVGILKELQKMPDRILEILKDVNSTKKMAQLLMSYDNFYFMGRATNCISAIEGSLKFKEISYKHAEAYPLGEMKHGPLALIDKNFFSVVVVPKDSLYDESCVNVREILSRSGQVLAITSEDSGYNLSDNMIKIPALLPKYEFMYSFLTTIPMQLISYYTATFLGLNPDKPRNLAKSVTVN